MQVLFHLLHILCGAQTAVRSVIGSIVSIVHYSYLSTLDAGIQQVIFVSPKLTLHFYCVELWWVLFERERHHYMPSHSVPRAEVSSHGNGCS